MNDEIVMELDPEGDVSGNAAWSISIDCCMCGNAFEECVDDMLSKHEMLEDFTETLKDAGWKNLNSEEYGQIGVACGDCVQRELTYRSGEE